MIGKCIAMFGAVGHIIFNYRRHPQCSYTKALQIIKVIDNTLHIAAMTEKNGIAVQRLISHAGYMVVAFHRHC